MNTETNPPNGANAKAVVEAETSASLDAAKTAIAEFTEAVALIEAAVADIDEHTESAKQTLTDHTKELLAIMNDKITAVVNSTVAVGITQIKAVAANIMAALGSAAKLAETYVDPKRKGY